MLPNVITNILWLSITAELDNGVHVANDNGWVVIFLIKIIIPIIIEVFACQMCWCVCVCVWEMWTVACDVFLCSLLLALTVLMLACWLQCAAVWHRCTLTILLPASIHLVCDVGDDDGGETSEMHVESSIFTHSMVLDLITLRPGPVLLNLAKFWRQEIIFSLHSDGTFLSAAISKFRKA